MCDVVVSHDIAHFPSHDQQRNLDLAGGVVQILELALVPVDRRHDARVPMPSPTSVCALAEVPPQAVPVGWLRAMREISTHGIDGIVEIGEPIDVRVHEAEDLVGTLRVRSRRDVDQHQTGDGIRAHDRDQQSGQAAQRRAGHALGPPVLGRLGNQRVDIGGVVLEQVVPIRPAAVAVAAVVQ